MTCQNSEIDLTNEQLDTLRNMLGINDPFKKEPIPYRNYAAVDPSNLKMKELELKKVVEKFAFHSSYDYYQVTEIGIDLAKKSFKKIRHKKSKRRYYLYLTLKDYNYELTFQEFLTSDDFKEQRQMV